MLQLATEAQPHKNILPRVAAELQRAPDDATLREWWEEVNRLLQHKDLDWLFHPGAGTKSFNEVPIQYRHQGRTVYGIIDRLLVSGTEVHLIDYKSHRIIGDTQLTQLAAYYKSQMALYQEGIQRLWPETPILTHLLFTHCGRLIQLK